MANKIAHEMEIGVIIYGVYREVKELKNQLPPQGDHDLIRRPPPLQTRLSLPPPPPCHGGWPSPARPSRMKFQPRPGFEALEVRGGRIFRSKHCFCYVFWGSGGPSKPLDPPKAPGGPWSPLEPLEAPAGPWSPLKRPGTVWKP